MKTCFVLLSLVHTHIDTHYATLFGACCASLINSTASSCCNVPVCLLLYFAHHHCIVIIIMAFFSFLPFVGVNSVSSVFILPSRTTWTKVSWESDSSCRKGVKTCANDPATSPLSRTLLRLLQFRKTDKVHSCGCVHTTSICAVQYYSLLYLLPIAVVFFRKKSGKNWEKLIWVSCCNQKLTVCLLPLVSAAYHMGIALKKMLQVNFPSW